jgi:Zn-dependent peptidase ImmA (M78 family)/transcriptional regulator with XRE-family HTH domain
MLKFNPQMLIIARDSRGMTQKQLAAAANVAQGSVSKVENGQLEPSVEWIAAFAHALNYPPSFFAATADDRLPVTFFRKQQALPASASKMIRAATAIRRLHIEKLIESVDLPANNVPSVDVRGIQSAAHFARELRIAWRVPHGPIANMTELLEDNGVVVVGVDFSSDYISGLSVYEARGGTPPMMFVSKSVPGDRLRFTLAHELAHMVFHHHAPSPGADCEDEADAFASEFLLPHDQVRGLFPSRLTLADLVQLKLQWGVSMQALLKRAQATGRVSENHATRLWRQISSLGYKKREPVDVAREEPKLMLELVRVHAEDLEYSPAQLSEVLHMNLDEFNAEYGREGRGLRLIKATK